MADRNVAFLFDMDGVIIDSNPVHREAWLKYNQSQGIATTEDMQQRMYGKRNDDIIRDFLGDHLTDSQVFDHGAAKERLFRELVRPMFPAVLVPGVREFLERHQDIPTGCATNAEAANVDFVLHAGKLAHLFRVTVNGHQVSRPKPFPDIYLKAAELLQVDPANCVVFEDSYTGIDAARAAGMKVVGLLTTHDGFPDVDLAIADFRSPALEPFIAQFVGNRSQINAGRE